MASTKDIMKLFKVRERTVRRWNAEGCPHTKDENGNNVYDPGKVAEWKNQCSKK